MLMHKLFFLTQNVHSEADPASKVRGRFLHYLVVKSHNSFAIVRQMKYISQHYCDKTMDDKMALYHECCFPNCAKWWQIKLLS